MYSLSDAARFIDGHGEEGGLQANSEDDQELHSCQKYDKFIHAAQVQVFPQSLS